MIKPSMSEMLSRNYRRISLVEGADLVNEIQTSENASFYFN